MAADKPSSRKIFLATFLLATLFAPGSNALLSSPSLEDMREQVGGPIVKCPKLCSSFKDHPGDPRNPPGRVCHCCDHTEDSGTQTRVRIPFRCPYLCCSMFPVMTCRCCKKPGAPRPAPGSGN